MSRRLHCLALALALVLAAPPAAGQPAAPPGGPAAARSTANDCTPQPQCRAGLTTMIPGAASGIATRGGDRAGRHGDAPATEAAPSVEDRASLRLPGAAPSRGTGSR